MRESLRSFWKERLERKVMIVYVGRLMKNIGVF